MHWEEYEPELIKQVSLAPGGTELADLLIEMLEISPDQHLLDLCQGPGVIASVVARENKVKVTSIVGDPVSESEAEATARLLEVSDRVRVIPGSAIAIPVPSEEFNSVYCLGYPFTPVPTPELVREIYRVLVPDGIVAFAGPVTLSNITPDHMESGLSEFEGQKLRTPAYTALHFSRDGFHIATAEYFHGAWDYWVSWLADASPDQVPDTLRKALIEDGGRWMSLGVTVLRKPPRPNWAV